MESDANSPGCVLSTGSGAGAEVQLGLLRLAGAILPAPRRRGIGLASSLLGWALGRRNYAIVSVHGGGRLRVQLSDRYWIRYLLFADSPYEPEVAFVLNRVLGPKAAFIDAGANIGYWSVLAARRGFARDRIIAIEASPTTFKVLEENARLNADCFVPVNAAITDVTGESAYLLRDAARPQQARLVTPHSSSDQRDPRLERVGTTTLDDIVSTRLAGHRDGLVIKLDVEGHEVPVLQGAAYTLQRHPLIIYEDHSSDSTCAPTRFIMHVLGYRVFHFAKDGFLRLRDVDEARAIKTAADTGYNFFACTDACRFADFFLESTEPAAARATIRTQAK